MLSSVVSRTTATGSDSTATYNYNFRIFANADLLVVVKNTTTLIETTLTLTTDYTVAGVGQASGSISLTNSGQVWMDPATGFLANGYIIMVRRVRPLQQNTSIRNQGTFYAAVHEDEFDNLTMIDQQHWDQISRSVRLPETVLSSVFNPVLPTLLGSSPPPGSVLQVNATANGWAIGSALVGWKAIDLPFSLFQAGALTDQITAFSVPAGCILLGVALKHTVAFAGGSISDVNIDLGLSGQANLFLTQFDVFQAVADSAFTNAMVNYIGSFASATSILINATSVGANLSALTQGSVRVYYWYMNLAGG